MAFLDFSFKVHRLLAKDLDQLQVDLTGWLWTVVPRLWILFVFGVPRALAVSRKCSL